MTKLLQIICKLRLYLDREKLEGGKMVRTGLAVVMFAFFAAGGAGATVVASSLPYKDTPDWTDIVFSGTAMSVVGAESILTTSNVAGVWFGWVANLNEPGWSIANNNQGNYLSLNARFVTGSDDWTAYMDDNAHYAVMNFNETACSLTVTNNSCYGDNGTPGVSLYFAGATPGSVIRQFVPLETGVYNHYEWLLLGSSITYRINGMAYSGTALPTLYNSKLLVIGDSSGSTYTGAGQMRISNVLFERAPDMTSLPNLVPEPASWAMLIAGFGLVGAAMRRRNKDARALFA